MALKDETTAGSAIGLRRDAIGLREVLFQSITDMAPGAAIAASIPAGAALAGGSLPLSVVFALIACLLCAWCIGLLSREMPAAGSLATYAARGLHPSVGFLVAWAYVLVGWLIPPLVLLQLGFTTASTINSEWHGYPANLWWPWSLAGAVIILAAGWYGIRTSARLGTILGVSEIAVFLVLAVFLVVHAGSNNTAQVFTTHYSPTGLTGVIGGSVFTLLAFGGFEGAAPLAEEARNPRRTIQRAVLLATLLIGLLYVFTTYAIDVAYGPKGFTAFASQTGNASWEGIARSLYGIFWFFVFLAIVNSTIANANAGVNVSSRTAYAMGRIGAFPRFLAIVSPRHRSPIYSILVAFVITVAVTLALGTGVVLPPPPVAATTRSAAKVIESATTPGAALPASTTTPMTLPLPSSSGAPSWRGSGVASTVRTSWSVGSESSRLSVIPIELTAPVVSVSDVNGACPTAIARSPTGGATAAKVSGVSPCAPTAWSSTTP